MPDFEPHDQMHLNAADGWLDERAVTMETMLALRRAGADFIVTYSAADVAQWLKEG